LQFVDRTAEDAKPLRPWIPNSYTEKNFLYTVIREGIEPSTLEKAFVTDTFFVTFSAPEGIEHTSQRSKASALLVELDVATTTGFRWRRVSAILDHFVSSFDALLRPLVLDTLHRCE
jgi:hypothetical protein